MRSFLLASFALSLSFVFIGCDGPVEPPKTTPPAAEGPKMEGPKMEGEKKVDPAPTPAPAPEKVEAPK